MMINESALFKGIGFDTMHAIVDIASEGFFQKNTILFEKGQTANTLYILADGCVNLSISNGAGHITFKLTEPGEVFGWSSMFGPGRYTATGICATDVRVLKIDRFELDRIFHEHPDVGIKVLKRLGNVVANRLSSAYGDLLSRQERAAEPSYG